MNTMKMAALAAAIIASAWLAPAMSHAAAVAQPSQQVLSMQAVTPANSAVFTGSAWVRPLFSPTEASHTYGASVTFAPGTRTYWHMHPTQQTLIVIEGQGYVQEWGKPAQAIQAGDVVICPPGVKHWHGATADSTMTHIALSEKSDQPVQWFEEVKGE